MEGKSNSSHHMGDVVVSPLPSPLQQQNFASGSHSPADAGKTVKMPTITIDNVIIERDCDRRKDSDEEDQLEQFFESAKRSKSFSFRKRKKSVHNSGGSGVDGTYIPPYKLRRMYLRRQTSSSPVGGGLNKTSLRFLLGGNAHDPLNLNGLGDSDNAVTPKTSPMPIPPYRVSEIPIMIPKNYQDPLRLMADEDVENTRDVIEGVLPEVPPHTKRKRHRRRSLRKRNESECSIESVVSEEEEGGDPEEDAAAVVRQLQEEKEAELVIIGPRLIQTDSSKTTDPTCLKILPKPTPTTLETISETIITVTKPQYEKEEITTKEDNNVNVTAEDEKIQEAISSEKESITTTTTTRTDGNETEGSEKVPSVSVPPPPYPPSDYIPLSSHYQPSPFVLDTMNENFTVLPFESPSMSNYMATQDTYTITEPFSPPPRPRDLDLVIEHRVPSGHYSLTGYTPPRTEFNRRRENNSTQSQPKSVTIQQTMFNRRHRQRLLDPIVSPVFPNFGSGKRFWSNLHGRHHKKQQETKVIEENLHLPPTVKTIEPCQEIKKFRPKDKIFQYGNYNQYYGYRNHGHEEDGRLRGFKKEWIEGRDVLDIGCNIGHVTLCIARDYGPRRIVGIDIDSYLVKIANKNIKHYVDRDPNDVSIKFPQSLPVLHGSLQPPQLEAVGRTPEWTLSSGQTPGGCQNERKQIPFPYNVYFRHENYVLDADELLMTVKPQYDVILCLSTTKWVHLNFGDDGLKRFFRRGFLNLRPGGLFILEPQPWSSYKKKKKLTEQIFQTFQSIKFFPKDFESFLLQEVGYTSMKLIGIPAHHSKGFQRPIYVFMKSNGKIPVTSIQL